MLARATGLMALCGNSGCLSDAVERPATRVEYAAFVAGIESAQAAYHRAFKPFRDAGVELETLARRARAAAARSPNGGQG